MRVASVLGVLGAFACAARPDLGFGLVPPAFAFLLFLIGIDALRHVIHPIAAVRVVSR